MSKIANKIVSKKRLDKIIYQERTAKNITLNQLAKKLGISPAYLGFIERGEREANFNKLTKTG